jgi:hypothetical protein
MVQPAASNLRMFVRGMERHQDETGIERPVLTPPTTSNA